MLLLHTRQAERKHVCLIFSLMSGSLVKKVFAAFDHADRSDVLTITKNMDFADSQEFHTT